MRRLLDSAADVPAYVVGRNADVPAWNRLAAALITDFGGLRFWRRGPCARCTTHKRLNWARTRAAATADRTDPPDCYGRAGARWDAPGHSTRRSQADVSAA
ncbi:MmyB family transcriptional regulator [Streptomyces sioyaensis]|uniref:MmyB family transcriptional regulator n=1 Tax=Streptomyces sioyaensis TaxID=67364 RepID=UPI003F53F1AC